MDLLNLESQTQVLNQNTIKIILVMKPLSRRNFLAAASAGITGVALTNPVNALFSQQNDLSRKITRNGRKVRVALVGTGSRGTATWGANLIHP